MDICKTDINKGCRIESYIPEYLKRDFKEGAILQSLTFTQQFVSTVDAQDELVEEEEVYDVSIKIIPRNQSVDLTGIDLFLNKVGNMTLKVGDRIKALSEFEKRNGALRNDDLNKTSPFTIDDTDKVRPVIILEKYLQPDENGEFNREELKEYCNSIKRTICSEIYAIQ